MLLEFRLSHDKVTQQHWVDKLHTKKSKTKSSSRLCWFLFELGSSLFNCWVTHSTQSRFASSPPRGLSTGFGCNSRCTNGFALNDIVLLGGISSDRIDHYWKICLLANFFINATLMPKAPKASRLIGLEVSGIAKILESSRTVRIELSMSPLM